MKTPNRKRINNSKINDLAKNTESGQDEFLTTNQGLRINDDQNSLKAGENDATLLEDFQLREKNYSFWLADR
jgi:catalase